MTDMTDLSPKKVAANRKNAKKGGVKTDVGKVVSKYNALKHGLLSKEVLLSDESGADLISLGRKLRNELLPETEMELMLVDRITANAWRLRRAMLIEREMMEHDRQHEDYQGNLILKSLGDTLAWDFRNEDMYGKFVRYESSIERGIYKALHELERLQARRKGEKVPPPLALDVDVSGDKNDGFVS